ncbi:MAG: CPBP family intramembrane glutamic endopeptidase [Bacteroidales bacterium]
MPESYNTQYSLKKILTIWILSSLPMAILAFVITPALIPVIKLPPLIIYWLAINLGLLWQFILSIIVLKNDGYVISWSTIRKRLWFQRPRNPKTGVANLWLFLWVIPFIILNGIVSSGIGFPDLDRIARPLIKNIPQYDLSQLESPEFKGEWWILGVFIFTMAFNYFLGEEFLYRGILLPKMNGVFGKWDWFANGILFGFYHLHKPQIILSTAVLFGFIFAYPAKRFQSNWMAVIIHGLEGLLGLVIVFKVILGVP